MFDYSFHSHKKIISCLFILRIDTSERVYIPSYRMSVHINRNKFDRLYLEEPSWSWSYGSWINNYPCNQCLLPLTLWVRIPLRRGVLDTSLCDEVCQWLETGRWFSPGTPISSTNKTDRHDITEILLKVTLNTIPLNP